MISVDKSLWKDPYEVDANTFAKLQQQSDGSDFYFSIFEDDTFTYLLIVPKLFWHEFKELYLERMNIEHLLPEGVSECMEGAWDIDADLEEVKQDMLERGFTLNKEVDDEVLNTVDWFDDEE